MMKSAIKSEVLGDSETITWPSLSKQRRIIKDIDQFL